MVAWKGTAVCGLEWSPLGLRPGATIWLLSEGPQVLLAAVQAAPARAALAPPLPARAAAALLLPALAAPVVWGLSSTSAPAEAAVTTLQQVALP